MSDMMESMSPAERQRIEEIAQELASIGLGVFYPHSHDATGAVQSLAPGTVSYEKDRKVEFKQLGDIPSDTVAVGWRWEKDRLVVCAGCCAFPPPPPSSVGG